MWNLKRFAVYGLQLTIAISLALLSSCNNSPNKPTFSDTPTSGEINIVCDESYEPLISAETDTFLGIYQYAKVHVKYLPEGEAFRQLVTNDSVRLIVAARELNESEKDYFNSRHLIPRTTKVAVDAVALVINNENSDSLMKFEQLKNIINGTATTWKQLNPKSKFDSITIVFDKSGSANARYLQQKFLIDPRAKYRNIEIPKNWFATNSNAEVVDYVSKNKNALGVISVNWISDKDDPMANQFLNKIRVVELSPPDTSKYASEYFKTYQAYISLKQYPLIRDVFIISREGRNGLGTGFASFVAGDQGQRIVRLMGMLPATMPVRLIQMN
jgi:phosphate transport system substrate-binding protein